MGLLSGLKKLGKKLLSGAKKVFKSAVTKVAKVLNNKYVKFAMLAAAVIVPGIGLMTSGWSGAAANGAGLMGKVGGALGNLAKGTAQAVLKMVVTPVKAVLNAGAKGASMFSANGLASTLSNSAKMLGEKAGSLFGPIQKDSLSQIIQKWSGGAATTDGVAAGAVNTAAGLNETSAQFGDIAQKVTADGGLTSAAQAASNAGNAAGGGGLLKKTLGFVNNNPEVAKMAFSAVSSAMAPDEADLMKQQYDLENKYRQEKDQQWNNFSNPTAAAVQQPGAQQPYDWRKRAQDARDLINNPRPLLSRSTQGAY